MDDLSVNRVRTLARPKPTPSVSLPCRCLHSVGLSLTPEQLRQMVRVMDSHGDGLIPAAPVLEFLREEAGASVLPGDVGTRQVQTNQTPAGTSTRVRGGTIWYLVKNQLVLEFEEYINILRSIYIYTYTWYDGLLYRPTGRVSCRGVTG